MLKEVEETLIMTKMKIEITKSAYDKLHEDYRGIYTSDDIHGTKLNGKRTMFKWLEDIGTVLLVEGESFEFIAEETEEIFPRKCEVCQSGMHEGFHQYAFVAKPKYFCSEECLHTEFSKEAWNDYHESHPEYFFFTQWEIDLNEE